VPFDAETEESGLDIQKHMKGDRNNKKYLRDESSRRKYRKAVSSFMLRAEYLKMHDEREYYRKTAYPSNPKQ
jgi:hypothetical protein